MDDNILIVGAGPSGLALAVELARRGIDFKIIDKANGPAPMVESRALAVNPRTLAILKASGATQKLVAAGHSIRQLRFFWQDHLLKEFSLNNDNDADDSASGIISIPQGRVERILMKVLADLGHAPHWQTELVNFTNHFDKISATLSKKGKKRIAKCNKLIGCDGAHSVVRKLGGFSFDGTSNPMQWGMADLIVDTEQFANTITASFYSGGAFATIAMDETRVRIISTHNHRLESHPTLKHAMERTWQSEFQVSYRIVKKFTRNNVHLCGDAAHIHSPIGGRGMNLGIEDAATLAYLISQNRTGEYDSLRHPTATKVLNFTKQQTNQLLSDTFFSNFSQRYLLPVALSIPPVANVARQTLLAHDTPAPEWLE